MYAFRPTQFLTTRKLRFIFKYTNSIILMERSDMLNIRHKSPKKRKRAVRDFFYKI